MTRQLRWGDASRMDSAEQGRQQILECALAAMSEMGPEGFAIDDVARRANISRRTLYRYFATKQALVQAVISSENAGFFSAMQEQLVSFEDDFERYRRNACALPCATATSTGVGFTRATWPRRPAPRCSPTS